MAEIRFTPRAHRDIRTLPPKRRRDIEVALDELLDNPTAGDRLHGDWTGYWKLRAGAYRVIYRISNDTVEVMYGRHRQEAYRKR